MRSQDQHLEAEYSEESTANTGEESGDGPEKRRERFAGWLGESPGVQIVTLLGELGAVISIIVAGVTYYAEAPERTKEKHYQAWQAINTAQGQGGSGGRVEALEDLNSDRQSLAGLSAADAFLQEVDLVGAELDHANLQRANLGGADLREASLRNIDLREADLSDSDTDDTRKATLRDAHLEDADLRRANLSGVILQEAKLNNADLNEAVLDGAQLQGAVLKDTVLNSASLVGTNLQDADFQNTDLWYADLSGANLRGARHLTQEQIDEAFGDHETVLPEGLRAPSNWTQTYGQLSELGSLPPGEISTNFFDAPMSFSVGEGWVNNGYESDSYIELGVEGNTYLGILILAPQHVYDPQNLSSARTLPVPKDMVAWLQDHPYLHAEEPVERSVGGIAGRQFDLQIPTMPEDYPNELCEAPCLPVFVNDPGGTALRLYEGGYRVIVLPVQDQTVVIVIDLEEGTPEKAEEVLKTIEWEGV